MTYPFSHSAEDGVRWKLERTDEALVPEENVTLPRHAEDGARWSGGPGCAAAAPTELAGEMNPWVHGTLPRAIKKTHRL